MTAAGPPALRKASTAWTVSEVSAERETATRIVRLTSPSSLGKSQASEEGRARAANPRGPEKLWQAYVVRRLINLLVTDAMETCLGRLRGGGVDSPAAAREAEEPLVGFSPGIDGDYRRLKDFLMEKLYRHFRVLRMAAKAERILRELFNAYVTRIEIIPPTVREAMSGESPQKIACDYIAGMTDRFALDEYRRLFDPYTRV